MDTGLPQMVASTICLGSSSFASFFCAILKLDDMLPGSDQSPDCERLLPSVAMTVLSVNRTWSLLAASALTVTSQWNSCEPAGEIAMDIGCSPAVWVVEVLLPVAAPVPSKVHLYSTPV